ncbi:MAG: hypothetical protein K9N51_02905 [Candidatus Pacebacteria bacterium]|nr:hypothetical protein [Candidatus Paceibacterota bacterium]
MSVQLYPLTFRAVTRVQPWAGNLLGSYLEGMENTAGADIAEYWQVIDDGELQSTVAEGPLAGTALSELRRRYPQEFVGRRHMPEHPFPLCLRLLDVGEDQPLLVHPDCNLEAGAVKAQPNAKFWYSLAAKPGASVVAGIAPRVTGQQLLNKLSEPERLKTLVQRYPARVGDSYLVMPGIVHSLGAGNLLVELQEHNVPALALSNWDTDNPVGDRERDAAMKALHIVTRRSPRISRESSAIQHTRRLPLTPNCPHFIVDEIRLFDHISLRTTGDSFHLLVVLRGAAHVEAQGGPCKLPRGTACCIPAALGNYKVEVVGNEPCELLRVARPFLS